MSQRSVSLGSQTKQIKNLRKSPEKCFLRNILPLQFPLRSSTGHWSPCSLRGVGWEGLPRRSGKLQISARSHCHTMKSGSHCKYNSNKSYCLLSTCHILGVVHNSLNLHNFTNQVLLCTNFTVLKREVQTS